MGEQEHLAIASVPIQRWGPMYEKEKALLTGTIFPEMNKPFYKANDEMMERGNPSLRKKGKETILGEMKGSVKEEQKKREEMLQQIYEISFVMDDIRLYMDTHPQDRNGLEVLKEAVKERKMLLKTFASEQYPLTMDCMADIYRAEPDSECNCWQEGPMPWEGACV